MLRQCLSASEANDFFLDRYISVRPPTILDRESVFVPCKQKIDRRVAERGAKQGRRCAPLPFLLFGGPRAPRGIIIITGSPIKLRGSSSDGEPPRCGTHTRVRMRTRSRAHRRDARPSEPGTGFARRRSTPKACHDAPRSCARPDKSLLKRNSHGSPLYTVDNAIRPSRSKK